MTISSAEPDEFLAEFMVVYVPPIRDIASDGLAPLKGLLGRALRSAKKGQSIAALNAVVRTALTQKGNEVLQKAGNEFGSIDAIGKVAADALGVDVALAVEQLKLKVKLAGKGDVPLAALGTGHQSQVVMNLFGALGASFQGQVIYMFEEPDSRHGYRPSAEKCPNRASWGTERTLPGPTASASVEQGEAHGLRRALVQCRSTQHGIVG